MDLTPNRQFDEALPVVVQPVHRAKRLWASAAVRRVLVLILLAAIWQAYGIWLDNELVFPTFAASLRALAAGVVSGEIPAKVLISLQILLVGYSLGLVCAGVLVAVATTSLFGDTILETLTAMLMPLPSIVLLPLAMLWFGLGTQSLIFVLLHAVTWVVAMNTYAGFKSVSPTLRMVGRNCALSTPAYIAQILVPAAFPSILTGLKIGWAFAWRTLVAAELVFGASSSRGGLGWYIFQNKNELEIPNVFAGLLAVIAIGLLVDLVLFRGIEGRTVVRWGMLGS